MPEVKGKKYPYTPEGVAAAEEAKRSTFTLKSGNSPFFKQMGSSPLNQNGTKSAYETIKKTAHPNPKVATEATTRGSKKFIKEGAKKVLKNVAKKGLLGLFGGKALTTAAMYLSSMGTAKATQPGTGEHGGTKTKTYNPDTGKYE